MTDQFQDVDFTGHSLHVCYLHDLLLLQDLDCHFLLSMLVSAQADLAEGALP